MAAPGRPSSLHTDVPPTLAVDPGRHTALLARIGTQVLATTVITSEAAPRAGQRIHACPPDPEALARVIAALAAMAEEHVPAARAWWAARGHDIPAGQTPWLLGVEKVILPVEDAERGYKVTPDILAPLIATSAIAYGVGAAWGLERSVWVIPHAADTRWQNRYGGTGRMEDYWPACLLASSETHVRAAWHHASDAAEDYERACVRRHGRLLPPHLGLPTPMLVPALLGAGVRPVDALPAPRRVPVTIPAQRTRTTPPVADLAVVAATLADLRTAAVEEGRPLAVVVADHLADSQPSPFDLPDAWSAWAARKAALTAAVRAA